jgi:hypothetical protein
MRQFIGQRDFGEKADSNAGQNGGPDRLNAVEAIAALEKRLGVALFNRSTRSVTLTDQGQRYCRALRS